jgi:WD40 repeat protein
MVRIVRHPAPVFCVAWNRDGSRLYTGSKDGWVRVVDGDSDTFLGERKLVTGWVISLAVHNTQRQVLGGSSGGQLHIFGQD